MWFAHTNGPYTPPVQTPYTVSSMPARISTTNIGYRGRLAPSPTGYLHVGHARTFWTAWQRAREAGGTLVMRMDDLDEERSKDIYAEAVLEDLHWFGIRWQEGPDKEGPHGPYVQSKRRATYLTAWRKLLKRGYIFPCRCSRKDLENSLGAPHENTPHSSARAAGRGKFEPLDDEPIYPGTCRHLQWRAPQLPGPNVSDIEGPAGINWRFHVRDGEVVEFDDINLGPQRFVAGEDFGDFVVWRKDDVPSYQLACVADDISMDITENLPRSRLQATRLLSLPAGCGPQRPPPGQAARRAQPAHPAPARTDADEYPLRRTARASVAAVNRGRLPDNRMEDSAMFESALRAGGGCVVCAGGGGCAMDDELAGEDHQGSHNPKIVAD